MLENKQGPNQDTSILVNPLHCFKLFTSSSIVRTTALACMFASFVEGKNMSAVNSMYLRNQLGLDALRASRYVVLYGIAMYTSGQYWYVSHIFLCIYHQNFTHTFKIIGDPS